MKRHPRFDPPPPIELSLEADLLPTLSPATHVRLPTSGWQARRLACALEVEQAEPDLKLYDLIDVTVNAHGQLALSVIGVGAEGRKVAVSMVLLSDILALALRNLAILCADPVVRSSRTQCGVPYLALLERALDCPHLIHDDPPWRRHEFPKAH